MAISFFEAFSSISGRRQFDEQIDELVNHAYDILKTRMAFLFLYNEECNESVYISRNFQTLEDSAKAHFETFAQHVVAAAVSGDDPPLELVLDGVEPSVSGSGALALVGLPVASINGRAIGSFVAAKTDVDKWTDSEKRSLHFLANTSALFLQLKQTIFELRSAEDERQQSLRQLSDVEDKFAGLAKNVPGAIFRYARDPSGTDSIEFMSPGCASIWGYQPEELEGDPALLWASVLPEDAEAVRASVQQSHDELLPWQHRWRIRTKHGFLKWLQSYATPFRKDDGGVAWDSLILDVTVEQDAQIALAENIRLLHETQKFESIGRLAGGVAHDFNNLLSVIIGNAEAIDRAGFSEDDEESIKEIIEASQRGAVLVKHLLSFARKSDLRVAAADIQQVLIGVDKLLRRVLPANIALEISQRAGLWPVQIDKNLFEGALLNIVLNARDAMQDGGAITIETSNVRIDHDYLEARDEDAQPGRYVMVAVTDTGAGIDEAIIPYVFEPFFSTKGPSDGTGLGLAMVQGFVKQSGGIVRIYSEVERGTSVKMFFPVAENDLQALEAGGDVLPKLERKSASVLLVEDQESVRRVIEKTLVSAGYRVVSAASGDEAIEVFQLRYEEIDIIITDVVMPGKIQGPQLVRLARKLNNNVPVLYMSGYPHEANVHGNGVRPEDISLMKPIRRTDLLTALAKLRRRI